MHFLDDARQPAGAHRHHVRLELEPVLEAQCVQPEKRGVVLVAATNGGPERLLRFGVVGAQVQHVVEARVRRGSPQRLQLRLHRGVDEVCVVKDEGDVHAVCPPTQGARHVRGPKSKVACHLVRCVFGKRHHDRQARRPRRRRHLARGREQQKRPDPTMHRGTTASCRGLSPGTRP